MNWGCYCSSFPSRPTRGKSSVSLQWGVLVVWILAWISFFIIKQNICGYYIMIVIFMIAVNKLPLAFLQPNAPPHLLPIHHHRLSSGWADPFCVSFLKEVLDFIHLTLIFYKWSSWKWINEECVSFFRFQFPWGKIVVVIPGHRRPFAVMKNMIFVLLLVGILPVIVGFL